jgi:hypothetical protein
VTPHDLVDGLARLGREASGDALTAAEQAGWQRLERNLARRGHRRRRIRAALSLALAAALCVVAVVFWRRERALTFEVRHGRMSEGGYIVSEAGSATVQFSDASELGIEQGTRLRLSHLEAHGARVMLEGGVLHVSIRPRPQATWAFDAGPYIVRVTGTEFDVAWDMGEQTLEVRMRSGKVMIEGAFADGAVRLEAGQRLLANARDGSFSITSLRSVGSAPPAASAVGEPGASTAAVATGEPPRSTAQAKAERPPGGGPARSKRADPSENEGPEDAPSWAARAAHGDFSDIVADAERRGIDRALADAPLGDLAALADAARYTRRPDLARRALLSERARFPQTVQARDAAFFLGGIAESSGDDGAALTWDETYLRESPTGAYASQALGRKMMIVRRLRGTPDARAIAAEYLRRFADGPYAASARKILTVP